MALPGPDNVFVIGPATFVFERGMGLNYHCGLKVTSKSSKSFFLVWNTNLF